MDAPGDARQRRAAPRRLRLPDRRARGGPARVGPVGHRAGWRSSPTIVDAVVAAVGRPPGPPARTPPRARRSSAPARDADLEGRHIVVTAGGTAEPIDPVRFIGNRSTGKMGVAIAEAALDRGARGDPDRRAASSVAAAAGDAVVVRAEIDRRDARRGLAEAMPTAAPTPWSWPPPSPTSGPPAPPRRSSTRDDGLTLELEPTEDILAEVGAAASPATSRRAPPGPRRVRRRDRLARPRRRQAPPQGRRPARRQRRRGGRVRLRDRHEPGHDPRPRTARATSCRCSRSARSPTGSSTASPRALDARDAARADCRQTGRLTPGEPP